MTAPPRRRFRATVHYDGHDFHGWQIQPTERTVQGQMERSLAELFSEEVRVTAAGRTDRGVHAVAQEVAYPAPERWNPAEMRRALNATLPADVWVEKLSEAAEGFHPRYDAAARRYVYLVATGDDAPSPLRRGRWWRLGEAVDEGRLRELTADLTGEGDFASFSKSGQPERGTRCRVEEAVWSRSPLGDLAFTVVADRFLHHMVRYLVATLVEASTGRRPPDEFRRLLEGASPSEPDGPRPPGPAPAEGLYLSGVRYPDGWNRTGGLPGLTPDAAREAS